MAKAKSLLSTADKAAREARRWKKELDLADKREKKDWREPAEKVVKRYRGEEKKKNRFNVLWSNTETLRPAIYNSRPTPDVRRRFRDADPIGKAVSEVLERALMVMVDYECTDQIFKNDTLDSLLVGRGVSRIRYIPSLRQVGETAGIRPEVEEGKGPEEEHSGSEVEEQEEVEYEQVLPEHVDWHDYREGYGRVWDEVPWVAFRHKLTKPDAEGKFGKPVISPVKFSTPTVEKDDHKREEATETQRVAEFWEIWDKLGQRVFFVQEEVEELLFPEDNPEGEPPIHFSGFFPCPEPMKIIENTSSLLPIIPFSLYEQQANELDKISARIDRITNAMRLRGVYDAKLSELSDALSNDDNELTPVQNAQAWMDGGLDKAISWFPTEKAAQILEALYEARERQKAIIDELTGISDIIRGATDPDETATAQQLKQTNASVRLQRMQKEVQRYAKDMMRLATEAMCEKFAWSTFAEMTELNFPSALQKQQAQLQAHAQAQMGQPPPPSPILQQPSQEDLLTLMRSSGMRRFKVDVETDSTVAATLNSDMQGMSQVLEAVGVTLEKAAPLVTSGALPVDAVKELVMAVVRRAKMGMAVEDAFEKLQAPKPPPPPPELAITQMKTQSAEKIAAGKSQAEMQKAQLDAQQQTQVKAAELQAEMQQAQQVAQIDLQKDAQEKQHELALKQHEADLELRKLTLQLENERLIADANNQTKLMIAELQAKVAVVTQANQQKADAQAQDKDIEAQGEQQDKQIDADQEQAKVEADLAPTAGSYQGAESHV